MIPPSSAIMAANVRAAAGRFFPPKNSESIIVVWFVYFLAHSVPEVMVTGRATGHCFCLLRRYATG